MVLINLVLPVQRHNTTDFGDLTRDTNGGNDAGGSNTRAVFLGGQIRHLTR